jgi:hypothetical protein
MVAYEFYLHDGDTGFLTKEPFGIGSEHGLSLAEIQ